MMPPKERTSLIQFDDDNDTLDVTRYKGVTKEQVTKEQLAFHFTVTDMIETNLGGIWGFQSSLFADFFCLVGNNDFLGSQSYQLICHSIVPVGSYSEVGILVY